MRAWLALLLAAVGCGGAPDTVTLRIPGAVDLRVDSAAIHYEPASLVASARLSGLGTLTIARRDSARALRVEVPGFCPVTVPAGATPSELALRPVIDLGADRPPLGFDARFSIAVSHGCPERGVGRISWRQLEGLPLGELASTRDGFQLSGRMPSFATAHPEPLPTGLVPISPRTQGRVVLEASWQGEGLPPQQRRLVLTATARATGVSSVAVTQPLLLAGAGWRVQRVPQGGHAQAHDSGSLSLFTPDAPGRWGLSDGAGRALTVQAFWHDKTPYDCGRSECHRAVSEHTVTSPMSHALERQLEAAQPAAVSCMLECHVLGERGLSDGGFLALQRELGWVWLDTTRWEDLPQALRRLGGVRCTACHGPGAIPEPDAREQILRADVCATCHDAPPRYTHVVEWQASRMARADAEPATRATPCARCHTTAGFLTHVAARGPHAATLTAAPAGIACAACHAPHASHSGPRLLRSVPDSGGLAANVALCASCHAPGPEELQPSAASAALVLGRVELPSMQGRETITTTAPHADVPGGCVGCHGGGERPGATRIDHSFRVDPKVCTSCHAVKPAEPARALAEHVAELARRLEQDCPVAHHASASLSACRTPQLTRARYAVALVQSDRAAAVHNATLARALLEDAERQLLMAR